MQIIDAEVSQSLGFLQTEVLSAVLDQPQIHILEDDNFQDNLTTY